VPRIRKTLDFIAEIARRAPFRQIP